LLRYHCGSEFSGHGVADLEEDWVAAVVLEENFVGGVEEENCYPTQTSPCLIVIVVMLEISSMNTSYEARRQMYSLYRGQ
jgi:hypothetical protein